MLWSSSICCLSFAPQTVNQQRLPMRPPPDLARKVVLTPVGSPSIAARSVISGLWHTRQAQPSHSSGGRGVSVKAAELLGLREEVKGQPAMKMMSRRKTGGSQRNFNISPHSSFEMP